MWNPVAGLIVFFLWYWILEFFRWITGWDTIINILFYGPLVIAIYYYVKNALLPTLNPNQNPSDADEMLKAVMRPALENTGDAKGDSKTAKETKRVAVVTKNPRSLDGLKDALQSNGYSAETFHGTIHYIETVKALKPEIILFYIDNDRPDAPLERALTLAGQYFSEFFRQDWIENIPVVVFSPNDKARGQSVSMEL